MQRIEDTLARKAEEIMTSAVTIEGSALVADAARLMKSKGETCVLVTEGNPAVPEGIVTERDIIYRILADGRSPYKVTINQIMSSPLIQIDKETPVAEAVTLMRTRNILRVAVTSEGRVVGLLNLRSIFGGKVLQGKELEDNL